MIELGSIILYAANCFFNGRGRFRAAVRRHGYFGLSDQFAAIRFCHRCARDLKDARGHFAIVWHFMIRVVSRNLAFCQKVVRTLNASSMPPPLQ